MAMPCGEADPLFFVEVKNGDSTIAFCVKVVASSTTTCGPLGTAR